MRHRYVRIALVLLYLGGVIAAGYQVVALEGERSSSANAHTSFDALSDGASASIAALKAAQQAYVASGQGVQYRMEQAASALHTLSEQLVDLKRMTTGQASATAVGAVAQTIDDFVELDERVREYAANGQVLMASDIIFTDGVEMLDGARESLDSARAAERSSSDITIAELTRRETTLLAVMAGTSLLVVGLLFVTGSTRSASQTAAKSSDTKDDAPVRQTGLDLSGALRTPDTNSPETRTEDAAGLTSETSIADISALCCDLARVQDADDLPALLARAARLLDATGVIVWLPAPGGDRLLPGLTHGYDSAVIKRMGTIPRDADNATASSYRDAELRTVAAEGESGAAIVTPLVAAHGCVGAMALEIAAGAETNVARQSLAAIVATQLAVLVSSPPAVPAQEPPQSQAQAGSS